MTPCASQLDGSVAPRTWCPHRMRQESVFHRGSFGVCGFLDPFPLFHLVSGILRQMRCVPQESKLPPVLEGLAGSGTTSDFLFAPVMEATTLQEMA